MSRAKYHDVLDLAHFCVIGKGHERAKPDVSRSSRLEICFIVFVLVGVNQRVQTFVVVGWQWARLIYFNMESSFRGILFDASNGFRIGRIKKDDHWILQTEHSLRVLVIHIGLASELSAPL